MFVKMEPRQWMCVVCLCLATLISFLEVTEAQCGRNCLWCKSNTQCIICRKGRHITLQNNGHRSCTRKLSNKVSHRPINNCTSTTMNSTDTLVCDSHCDVNTGCSTRGRGLCDGQCTQGFGPTVAFNCIACDPHCNTSVGCNARGGGLCDGNCSSGYGPTPSGSCVACDPHCDPNVGCNARGGGLCDGNCTTGYGFTAHGLCLACDANCDPSIGCNTRGGGKCDGNCTTGFGLTPFHTCLACDVNCPSTVGCNVVGGGMCDGNCSVGYGPTASHGCVECDPHCDITGCNKYGGRFCDVNCLAGYELTSAHTCAANDACNPATSPLNVTSYYGVIASINYPRDYDSVSNCQWLITSPNATGTIILNFDDVHTEDNYDIINIYDGDSASSGLIVTVSGLTLTQFPTGISTTQRYMFIQFISDDITNYRGFLATFRTY